MLILLLVKIWPPNGKYIFSHLLYWEIATILGFLGHSLLELVNSAVVAQNRQIQHVNECGQGPIKHYLQKQAVGRTWYVGPGWFVNSCFRLCVLNIKVKGGAPFPFSSWVSHSPTLTSQTLRVSAHLDPFNVFSVLSKTSSQSFRSKHFLLLSLISIITRFTLDLYWMILLSSTTTSLISVFPQ